MKIGRRDGLRTKTRVWAKKGEERFGGEKI